MMSSWEVCQNNMTTINVRTTTESTLSANVVTVEGKQDVKATLYQIYNKKGHDTLNCYNRYTMNFPSTNPHVKKMVLSSITLSSVRPTNLVNNSNVHWYLDSA